MDESASSNSRSAGAGTTERGPSLTPARWQQIKELFSQALELDANHRAPFLQEACGGDEDLRVEVESLLASADSDGAATSEVFKSLTPPGENLASEAEDPLIGLRVGDYRIDQRIGYGGMAAVYLASRADEQFQMRAAIKVLRPDLDHAELLDRFLKERQTLAALDHPNIVKLLDGGSTERGLPYLVMDYVEGQPVDEYCDDLNLSIQRRLQLFCTVCDAVEFAHQHRVIHRDLKPNNILVTADGVPKLLDFGIAKVLDPQDSAEVTITRTAARHLTPAYASPEQVRGERIGAASDVYSLGVVLYGLLTGHRPYRLKQRTPAAMERAICEQEPECPSTAVDRVESESRSDGTVITITAETVSRTRECQPEKLRHSLKGDLDNIVLKALQKDPQRRYRSVAEFAEDVRRHLEHRPVQARPNTAAYRISKFIRRRQTEVVATAAVLLVLAGAVAFAVWEEHRATEGAGGELSPRSGGRRAVAVLGFKNLSGRADLAWLSTAFSEMLTTDLAAGGQLRLIPGENVAQTKISLSLLETDSFGPATLHRIYRNLGSDYVVVGSFVEAGEGPEQIRLDLRLQDAVRGDTIVVAAAKGSQADLSGLVARAGSILREKLGVAAPSTSETKSVQASLAARPEAAQLYAEGLEKKRIYDIPAARALFEKAIAADPNYALAHLALSDIWSSFGDSRHAQEEARKAFELSGGLPREQSLMAEARYYETLHQWDKAIDIRRTLFNFFPDNLDHGLQLVSTQTAAARGADSLATVEALRKLSDPERNDPRIDLAEGYAANVVSDYKRQAVAAQRAIEKARAIGARLLLANALIVEGRAYMELGQKDKVGPILSEAGDIYASVGDRYHQGRVLQQVGLAFFYQGKLDEAQKTYMKALSIQRELGNRANEAKLLNGIALVLQDQNDLEGARQNYVEALAICRAIDDRAMTGTVLGNLGGIDYALGDFQSARTRLQESLQIAREVGEQSGIALQLENLALVLVAEGNLRGAVPLYEEALRVSRKTGKNKDLTTILIDRGDMQIQLGEMSAARSSYEEAQRVATKSGDQVVVALTTRSLGDIQFHHAELPAARQSFEQALTILEKTGDNRFAQDVRSALGLLNLEDGRPADAERESRVAAEEFRKSKASDSLAGAETVLARALLAENKIADAQTIAADAVKAASQGGTRSTQIAAATAVAEVQTASGKASEAANTLKQLVSDSRKTGIIPGEFEARLALSEAEITSGGSAAGRAQLASLEHDAIAKGFLLIARKAHKARSGHTMP